MVVRGRPAAKRGTTTRKAAPRSNATARKTTTARKAPAAKRPTKAAPDVTQYAEKEPTGYHKAFARWIVQEVGYDPNEANTKKAAFLAGVSIATAARPAFQNSDFLENWREASGESKRGPKPKTADAKRRATREVVSDDEFEDEGDEFEEDEMDSEDEDFDEESDSDEDDEFDEDEDESEEDDDEFEDEEEEEPEPPKRGRAASTRKAATTRGASTRSRTSAPSKKPTTRTRKATASSDDEDLF